MNSQIIKIKKLSKDKKICLEQEIKEYLELFYELFNQQNFKKAIRYIDLLKNELKGFPKLLPPPAGRRRRRGRPPTRASTPVSSLFQRFPDSR